MIKINEIIMRKFPVRDKEALGAEEVNIIQLIIYNNHNKYRQILIEFHKDSNDNNKIVFSGKLLSSSIMRDSKTFGPWDRVVSCTDTYKYSYKNIKKDIYVENYSKLILLINEAMRELISKES